LKPLWAQTAAGALICAVVAALTLLPAKLLGPAPHGRPLALPATIPVQPVHIALPKAKPHRAVVKLPPAVSPPAQVLASVRTPIAAPAPRPAPPRHHNAVKATPAPLVSPRRLQRPRLPRQELRQKAAPAPAPPTVTAPTVTAPAPQPAAPAPAPQLAAPATTTTAPVRVPPAPEPTERDHGKGHGHDHGHGHDR
jgi:hypothetical protein